MLDGFARKIVDPMLEKLGKRLAQTGVGADQLTLVGLVAGFLCAAAIVLQHDWLALVFLAANRLIDGLDGAVARETRMTDRGGFLDITCDFIFYGSVPLAFAMRDPAINALPAAVLLASFYANGASFLAFSAMAAKRRMETHIRGSKTLYFTTGLMEGSETILFFAVFVLLPEWFAPLAYLFAVLCALTCLSRIWLAWRVFGVDDSDK